MAKPIARAPPDSAIASERLCGGHRRFAGRIGLRTPNLTEEPPMSDEMMNLRALIEKRWKSRV
jgi:hypothetical protein